MPTYEYACTSCGEHLEVVQSFSDEPLTACPNCGGPLRKVFGSIGIVLKGSGFYKTDNRRGSVASGKPAGGGESSTSAPSSSSGSGSGSGSDASSASSSSSSSTTSPSSESSTGSSTSATKAAS